MNKKKARAILACIVAGAIAFPWQVWANPIQADPNASAAHRPIVQETKNGLPLVQIAPPNGKGVSHNQYQNFTVPVEGAILNNSFQLSKTQLAGYVQGNPNLNRGTASVILNEVTSHNLFNLNGFLEVAGHRADVILANPNGITVNGGGFINTSRAILATGKPYFDPNGNINHFTIDHGIVTVEGKGLDARQTDSLAILSRAAQINAGIWAKKLQVVTGRNQINAQTLQNKPIETKEETAAPEIALDVAAVGGMYADSIYLVGTEKGLGVNLEGKVQATGDISIDVHGNLHVKQETIGGGNVTLQAENLENKGQVFAGKNLKLHAHKTINNTGESSGQNLEVQGETIHNTGLLSADHTAAIKGNTLINEAGGKIYGDTITVKAKQILNRRHEAKEQELTEAVEKLRKQEKILEETVGEDVSKFHSDADIEAYEARIKAASEEYDRIKAQVDAAKQAVDTVAPGTIAARKLLTAEAEELHNNADSLLYSGGTLTAKASGEIVNQGARIESKGDMKLSAKTIRNENDLFATKRVVGELTENPERIHIDQAGHPEQGQTFDKSEFSNLGSGYGAYHHGSYEEEKERAGYGVIQQRTPEELANGEPPIAEELVGTIAPNYAYDDPIFQEMGVSSMSSPRPHNGDHEQAQWDAAYQKVLDKLNEKIDVYNEKVRAHNAQTGVVEALKIHDLTFVHSKSQTSHNEVTESRPGVILSGGDMNLMGHVQNKNSQIASGKTLHVEGKLDNHSKESQPYTVTFGTTRGSYTYKRGWPHKSRRRGYKSWVFMTPQKENGTSAPLGVSQVLENHTPSQGQEEPGQKDRQSINTFLDPFGTTFAKDMQGRQHWQNLLQSSLYQFHPESTAKYLLETDPQFTKRKNFLSSDYFFQQLQWDPDKVPKRIGDGFYEGELIRQQILEQTGQRNLEGYENDEEEFKSLMDAGIFYAKKTGLTPGIALSDEQMVQLTSDMVWMESKTVTYEGKPYEVLVPRVYLRPNREMELKADDTLVSGKKLWVETKGAIYNEGRLQGKTVILEGNSLKNRGILQGDTLFAHTQKDLESTGLIRGKDNVTLRAEQNLSIHSTKDTLTHQDVLAQVAGIAVTGDDGVLFLQSGKDLTLVGAVLQNLGRQGKTLLQAGNTIQLDTLKLSAEKDMTQDAKNYLRTQRKIELGTTVETKGDIQLTAGRDIQLRAANIDSSNGAVSLQAGNNITLEAGKAYTGEQYALSHKERGLLSRSSTETRTDERHEAILGSGISGKSVTAESGKDILLKGSSIVGDDTLSLKAGDITLTTETQRDYSASYKKTKKSGLMGSGMGILLGKEEKSRDLQQLSQTNVESIVGSIGGRVSIEVDNQAEIKNGRLLAGKDVKISGKDVTIENGQNTTESKEVQTYSRSGLSISLGGETLDSLQQIYQPIHRAGEVKDHRLQALYGLDAAQSAKDVLKQKGYNPVKDKVRLGLHMGISSSSSKADSVVTEKAAVPSLIQAKGDVLVHAEKDIKVQGSAISGENVVLDAGRNVEISAAENRMESRNNSRIKSAGVGATIGLTGQQAGLSFDVYGNKGKENEREQRITHTGSHITAEKKAVINSGKDTDIAGSQVGGKQVTIHAGENFRLESLQDSHTYTSASKNAGMSAGYSAGTVSLSGSASRQDIDSQYQSVTEQARVYAGEDGFNIEVGKNTDLKGAVIDSKAEAGNNVLNTGTLSWSDVKNTAKYKASGMGIGLAVSSKNGKRLHEDITPSGMPPTVSDKKRNLTKAAVAQGTIIVRDKQTQKQNLDSLNRETAASLKALGEIFDKTKVKERGEMGALFQRLAHTYIGELTFKIPSKERKQLNILADGIASYMVNGNALSGAGSTALLEYAQKELSKIKDPALKMLGAGILGASAGALINSDWKNGISAAMNTELYNHLSHWEQETLAIRLNNAASNKEKYQIIEEYIEASLRNRANEGTGKEVIESEVLYTLNSLTKYDNAGIQFMVNPELGLHENLVAAKDFLRLSKKMENLGEFFRDGTIFTAESIVVTEKIISLKTMTVIDTVGNIIKTYNERKDINDFLARASIKVGESIFLYRLETARKSMLVIPTAVGFMILENFFLD